MFAMDYILMFLAVNFWDIVYLMFVAALVLVVDELRR